MSRIDRLRDLADLLEASLRESSAGTRAQLAAQYRATLAEIDALGGVRLDEPPRERTGLSEFERRLREREATTARPRRTAR
jgi:hypothetical protein